MSPCQGQLIRAHLLPARELRKVGHDPRDPRSWVYACGGIVGLGGHHGLFDGPKRLRLRREAIPAGTEELAEWLGLGWFLDREFGPRHSICQ